MKKIFTPLLLSLSVFMGGQAAFADEVKELTADMYYSWTGFDADAIRGEQYADVEFNVGNDKVLEGGNVVCGDGSVSNWLYADLTGSSKLIFEGSKGLLLRVMFNRQADNSLVEKNPVIGDDGVVELDITEFSYVHLNTIKIGYNGQSGVVNSIKYVMPDDPLMVPKEALKNQISTAKMYNSIAYTEESFDALQNSIKDGEDAMSAATTVEALQDAKKAIEDAITGLKFAEGYVELTKDMFLTYASTEEPGEGTNPGEKCAYDLFKSTGLAYGDGNVSELMWADLTDYDSFIVTVAQGEPRFCMNRLVKDGQQGPTQAKSEMLDINPNTGDLWSTEAYQTISEDKTVFTIDLKKIVDGTEDLEGYGFARLHSIKGAHWGNVFVTGMYLYNEPKADDPTAVNAINSVNASSVIYNVYGQRVDESYRGIVIKNGKKFINK